MSTILNVADEWDWMGQYRPKGSLELSNHSSIEELAKR